MSGRYLLAAAPERVAQEFGLGLAEDFPPRFNIAPTQPIHIVALDAARQRKFLLVRWGFVPSWAKKDYFERMGTRPLFHARAETAAEKPTFRNAYRRRRCLIPADGFYEWKGEAAARTPFCVRRTDDALFAFGGLWETAVDADGGEIDTAAMLTVAAGPDLSALGDREPLVIPRADYRIWLEADERELKKIGVLIHAQERGFWRFYPVSTAVNDARREGANLAAPAVPD